MPESTSPAAVTIRAATREDVPAILDFIEQLADYERLRHEVKATAAALDETLFGAHPAAEVIIASLDGRDVGFALFFQTYSTFLARPGLHLEDLFVVPDARGAGIGRALLARLAGHCRGPRLRPARMGGAHLERARHPLLSPAGGGPP